MNQLKTIRLLAIEDSTPFAMIVQRWLEGVVDEVRCVGTLAEAEPYLQEFFDIIWYDLHMPGSTIDDVIQTIERTRTYSTQSVIVVVSGFIDEDVRRRAERAGADAIVSKDEVHEGWQIVAVILLGVMGAMRRGSSNSTALALILERASKLISEQYAKA